MEASDFFQIIAKHASLPTLRFFEWLQNKYGVMVSTRKNEVVGEFTMGLTTRKFIRPSFSDLIESVTNSIMESIAHKHNFHFDVEGENISSIVFIWTSSHINLVTIGSATVEDVYTHDKNDSFSKQLVLCLAKCRNAKIATLTLAHNENTTNIKDNFTMKCLLDLAAGERYVLKFQKATYFFYFTKDAEELTPAKGTDLVLVPFNIYDFIEVVLAMEKNLSPNLLAIRNKSLAFGHCFKLIEESTN